LNPIQGIDISHFNVVDSGTGFHGLYNAGIRFIFCKASQGVGFVDPNFKEYSKRIASMKNPDGTPQIYLGAYHFGDDSDPVAQVTHFLHTVAGCSGILPALDWESNPNGGTMDRAGAEKFVGRFHEVTGKYPLLYGSRSWFPEHGIGKGYTGILANCPLWLAAYRSVMPAPPVPWKKSAFWQKDDQGRIAGMTGVDLDVFQGTEAELRAFWAAHSVAA